jgi:hypothetical protein
MRPLRAVAPILAAVLAACGGAGMAESDPPPCPAAAGIVDPQATLVDPPSGATGVATTIGAVTFTVSNGALLQGTLTLWAPVPGGGTAPAVTAGPISSANGIARATIPALQSATTYTAIVRAAVPLDSGSPCMGSVTGNLGAFTTR